MVIEDFNQYYETPEPGKRERALGWATAIGLQDVDGLKPSQYLIETAKRNIEGEINADEARRLVDEYYETKNEHYENQNLGVERTMLYLEEFFKVLLYGDEIELHNRYMKIGQEYGTPVAKAIGNLHRKGDSSRAGHVDINVGINANDVGINVGIKNGSRLIETEELAVKAILRDSKVTAAGLSLLLKVTKRQSERIIASLKRKTNLHRVGFRKSGRWVFEDEAAQCH